MTQRTHYLLDDLAKPSFTYDSTERAVFWASVRLSPESCEDLLDVFEREGAAGAFNSLYAAHMAAGGIPRCSSLGRAA